MFVLKILPTIVLLNCVDGGKVENFDALAELIKDFVEYQDFPTKLYSVTCFSKSEDRALAKKLSAAYVESVATSSENILVEENLPQFQLFFIDFDCDDSLKLLAKAQKHKWFQNPYRWLAIGNETKVTELKNYDILVDSRFFVITEMSPGRYNLKAIFKYRENNLEYAANDIATWSTDDGFQYYSPLIISKTRRNLMGTHIKTLYVFTKPDTIHHLTDFRNPAGDPTSKSAYYLYSHAMTMINATMEFMLGNKWGVYNKTTKMYDGLVGDLQRRKIDIGGSPIFFFSDRVALIEYFATTTDTDMKFIFKAPPLSYAKNVFILPFDTSVWYANYVMIVVTIVLIYVIIKWEWLDPLFKKKIQETPATLKSNFSDVVMFEVGCITQQGTDVEPQSLAGRIIAILTLTILMFMYTSYSANIVVLLQATTDSFKTLDDLLQSRMKLGVEDVGYARLQFAAADEKVRKAIYEQKIAPKGQTANFFNLSVGISRMQKEFFAYHIELSSGYQRISATFDESEKCGLREISFVNWMTNPWMTMQKNSSFKEPIKVAMKRIHEVGLVRRVKSRIYTKKPQCTSQGSNFVSIGWMECYFPFYLFGFGVLFAFLLFVGELLTKHYQKSLLNGKTRPLFLPSEMKIRRGSETNGNARLEYVN